MASITMTIEEYEALMDLVRSKESITTTTRSTQKVTKKPRKPSAYQTAYGKNFRKVAAKYKKKNGSWKTNGFKRAQSEAHKLTKGAMKK